MSKLIKDARKECRSNAHKEIAALDALIRGGYGECELGIYSGTPYATHKTSNAYKYREYVRKQLHKEVVAEERGAKKGFMPGDGFYVYCAIK